MERAKTSDGYDLVIYYVKSYQIYCMKNGQNVIPLCRTSAQLNLQFIPLDTSLCIIWWIASICINWISFNYWNGMYAIVRKFRFGFNKMKTWSPIFEIVYPFHVVDVHIRLCLCVSVCICIISMRCECTHYYIWMRLLFTFLL